MKFHACLHRTTQFGSMAPTILAILVRWSFLISCTKCNLHGIRVEQEHNKNNNNNKENNKPGRKDKVKSHKHAVLIALQSVGPFKFGPVFV